MTTRRFQTGRHFDYGPTKSNSCQGRMVKQSLSKIIKAATALEAALDDNDDLPQWVHYKVATAEDRLLMAAQYMLYEINRAQTPGTAQKKVT
jgi:hypothetical protein